MSLSTTLDVARSSLAVTADLTQIASRNIARASDAGATRKIARLVTTFDGASRIGSVARSSTAALRDGMTGATSEAERLKVVSLAIDKLDLSGGDIQSTASPSSRLSAINVALQAYSSNPADVTVAHAVLSAASDLVSTLHDWAENIAGVRRDADTQLHETVTNLNKLLSQLATLNGKIINSSRAGFDGTDDLDARDTLVMDISKEVGVTVVDRQDNGILLYTDSGITLFDGSAREVWIDGTPLRDGAPGGSVRIDGVQSTGPGSAMPISSGRLAGLVEVRDRTTLTFGAQIDEIANGLVLAFAERDQRTVVTAPDAAGLFVIPGAVGLPSAGTWTPGSARLIELNANADPGRGGTITRLRDGGISEPSTTAYEYNTRGDAGFTGRIAQLTEALSAPRALAADSQLSQSASLLDLSSSSIGWVQGQRQVINTNSSYANTLMQRSQDALSKDAGINIDDEMTQLLELERTYQASAKLITAVDSMFGALIQAVG